MNRLIDLWIDEIRRYNQVLHLVSGAMLPEIVEHIHNTMELLQYIQEPLIADIGSGSGLPAIPYKILNPDSSVVMLERSQKKCIFLRHVIDVLKLEKIELVEADPLVTGTGPFPALMSRAFSPRSTLEKIVLKTCTPRARFYYLSTGTTNTIEHRAFSLAGRQERTFRNYTLQLDIYEITSRQ